MTFSFPLIILSHISQKGNPSLNICKQPPLRFLRVQQTRLEPLVLLLARMQHQPLYVPSGTVRPQVGRSAVAAMTPALLKFAQTSIRGTKVWQP